MMSIGHLIVFIILILILTTLTWFEESQILLVFSSCGHSFSSRSMGFSSSAPPCLANYHSYSKFSYGQNCILDHVQKLDVQIFVDFCKFFCFLHFKSISHLSSPYLYRSSFAKNDIDFTWTTKVSDTDFFVLLMLWNLLFCGLSPLIHFSFWQNCFVRMIWISFFTVMNAII